MRSNGKILWLAAVTVGILNLMVPISQWQAPNRPQSSTQQSSSLKPPATGQINVAFLISDGADVQDSAGPWEVFRDAMLTTKGKPWHESDGMAMDDMVMPFNLYTVSDLLKPLDANRLTIVPTTVSTIHPSRRLLCDSRPAWTQRGPESLAARLFSHRRPDHVGMYRCRDTGGV